MTSMTRRETDPATSQALRRWALEVAAAGGHHIRLTAPRGGLLDAGRHMADLLPDLTPHTDGGPVRRPPMITPRVDARVVEFVGTSRRQGVLAMAHQGILVLDPAPDYAPAVMDTLWSVLDTGEVVVRHGDATRRSPARFQMLLASPACPCGKAPDECRCAPTVARRYQARVPAHILTRVHIHVDLSTPSVPDRVVDAFDAPHGARSRVARARARQEDRWQGTGWEHNRDIPVSFLRDTLFTKKAMAPIKEAVRAGRLSSRGWADVMRVCWTLADLDGIGVPVRDHVDAALALVGRH